jgi:hypothetical protein
MEITRRRVLAGSALATGVAGTALADWEPNRVPDPAIKALDPSFLKYRPSIVGIERLATGMTWGEGPVWFGDGRYLLWSDIPNNRIMRWDEETGVASVYRKPSNQANGNTRDRQGRLVSCEHRGRRVTRTEYDGEITVLADRFEGKRLNSPNDVVVKSDDSIWFTDPAYGIRNNYNGRPRGGHWRKSTLKPCAPKVRRNCDRSARLLTSWFANKVGHKLLDTSAPARNNRGRPRSFVASEMRQFLPRATAAKAPVLGAKVIELPSISGHKFSSWKQGIPLANEQTTLVE